MLSCKQYIVFFYPVPSPSSAREVHPVHPAHMHTSLPYDRPVIDERRCRRRLSSVSSHSRREAAERPSGWAQGSTALVDAHRLRKTARTIRLFALETHGMSPCYRAYKTSDADRFTTHTTILPVSLPLSILPSLFYKVNRLPRVPPREEVYVALNFVDSQEVFREP